MSSISWNSHPTALALLPVAIIGSTLNWTIFYSFQKLSSLKHSFGYLSANQAFADAMHSSMFLLYFCPMVILESHLMKEFSYHAGFLILFFYELSVITHLAISINRFFAVFTPFRYPTLFSDTNTKLLLLGIWAYTVSSAVYLYQYLCKVYYDDVSQFLTFTPTELCGYIGCAQSSSGV